MLDRHEVLAQDEFFDLPQAHARRETLTAFRERLGELGFTEDAVARTLDIEGPYALTPVGRELWPRYVIPGEEPLPVLIRLFLLALPEPIAAVRELLGREVVDVLLGLRILEPDGPDGCRSPISLYPVGSLYVVTDWWREPKDGPATDSNRVMPLGRDSYALTRLVASCRGRSAVDLCTGSGVGALKAARTFEHVIGVDVAERAVNFARFNAVLNGAENCEFERGDLYDPVGSERFDLISANPPFVPSPRTHLLYRDGGAAGEDVLSRILGGFAAQLEPDGIGLVVSDLVEHRGVAYEEKVARWLGDDGGLTAVVLRRPAETIYRYVSSHISHTAPFGVSPALFEWIDHYRDEGIEEVARGYLAVRRDENEDTRVLEVPIDRPIARDLREGSLQAVLHRAATAVSRPIAELTFTPSFRAGSLGVSPRDPSIGGGELPYLVVDRIEAASNDGHGFSVDSLVASFQERGYRIGPRRRQELEELVRWLYVSGCIASADDLQPATEADGRRDAALEMWWSA